MPGDAKTKCFTFMCKIKQSPLVQSKFYCIPFHTVGYVSTITLECSPPKFLGTHPTPIIIVFDNSDVNKNISSDICHICLDIGPLEARLRSTFFKLLPALFQPPIMQIMKHLSPEICTNLDIMMLQIYCVFSYNKQKRRVFFFFFLWLFLLSISPHDQLLG